MIKELLVVQEICVGMFVSHAFVVTAHPAGLFGPAVTAYLA